MVWRSPVSNLTLHRLPISVASQGLKAPDVCRVGQGVDDNQPVVRSRRAPCMHKVLADETRAAGDQNALYRSSLLA